MRGYKIRHPPGNVLVTDRTCGKSGDGFCTFYDTDAIFEGRSESRLADGEYMCLGCNGETTEGGIEFADMEDVKASRKAQDPAYDG